MYLRPVNVSSGLQKKQIGFDINNNKEKAIEPIEHVSIKRKEFPSGGDGFRRFILVKRRDYLLRKMISNIF